MRKPSSTDMAKPFVKWAGGKSQILNEIRSQYPAGLGTRINKYAEPFVGGGAVLFDILNSFSLDEVYISDINRELIHTYKSIRDHIDSLVNILKDFESEYLPAESEDRKFIYYEKRDRFNELKITTSSSLESAALFIFLNRTCFNGLYRVNAKGGYNVPQGTYKNPCICDEENLRAVSNKLAKVKIVCGDYQMSRDFIDDRTFAYFDPPYRPLSTTANFTAYAQDGFDDSAQAKLAHFIDEMSERGASVLASNSDPKNADAADDFFDFLYAKHKIVRVEASRAINSKGAKRGKISELLIANRCKQEDIMDRTEAINKLKQLEGRDLHELAKDYGVTVLSANGKVNKGWAGHVCERYLGLPINPSQRPDFGSWELKSIPLKRLRNGSLSFKETMAITMIDEYNVKRTAFEESHLLAKLKKAVIVTRIVGARYDVPTFVHSVTGIDLSAELYEAVRADYELVRECLNDPDRGFAALTGRMGVYIQPRTKGPGGNAPKTRAFYARSLFLSQFVDLSERA